MQQIYVWWRKGQNLVFLGRVSQSIDFASDEPTFCADSRAAEEATEATEATLDAADKKLGAKGAFTEHIFTDPLGAQHTAEALANYSQR